MKRKYDMKLLAELPFNPTKWRFIALPEHIIYKNIYQ